MVKVVDGKHYMMATKHQVFRNLILKAEQLYDFQMKVNWFTRTITLESESAAERFYSKLYDARGVRMIPHGRQIKVSAQKLNELVD